MNILKLPFTLCSEIDAMITRFWWGPPNGDKKIHWKKWTIMSKAKAEGGCGFRDVQAFNSAMLTSTVARVLSEPDAIWVRMLKGLYFPNCNFLQATKWGRLSWGWSSVLIGRDVLKQTGVWTVGGGRSIRPFQDQWIAGTQGPGVRARPHFQQEPNTYVVDWIDSATKSWREDLVREAVHPDDVEIVLQQDIPMIQHSDILRWPHTRSGKMSVRTAYHSIH